MAVGSYDGYVRIIERRTGIIEHAWPMAGSMTVQLAYSPDATRLLVLSDLGETESLLVQVDVGTGAILGRKMLTGPARAALSGDGKLLAAGHERATAIALFDTETFSDLPAVPIPEGVVARTIALSEDGRMVALGLPDGTVVLLDRSTPATPPPAVTDSAPERPSCGQGPVSVLVFSPDGSTLACATEKSEALSLLTVPSLAKSRELAGPLSGIRWAKFIQSGKTLLVASGKGLREVSVADGSEIRKLRSGEGELLSVETAALAPDGKGLGAADGFYLVLFESLDSEGRNVGPDMLNNYRVSISADAGLAVFTTPLSVASVSIDLATGTQAAKWNPGELLHDFWSALDATGKVAAVKTHVCGFRIIEPRSGKVLHTVDIELQSGTHLTTLSPDGTVVLASRDDVGQSLYDVKTGTWGRALDTECSGLPAAFAADNKTLFIAPGNSYSSDICVVDLQSGADAGALRGGETGGTLFDFALSPSGKRLVSVYATKSVLVWDTDKRQVIHRVELPETTILAAFAPDEKSVAVLSMSGTLYLWDLKSGKPTRAIEAVLPGAALAAVFTKNGKRIFLAESDGSVRVVDVESGRTLATTQVLSTGDWLTWSPDGWFDGSDGAIALYRVRTQEGFVPLKERASEWRKSKKLKEILGGR
jgi:WD40 repeat protein